MKKIIFAFASLLALTACNDWLREDSPMTNKVSDYFISAEAANQVVIAAYVPMMWEYNNTYFSEFFIGDVASDDALKGGQNISDMADAYDIDNFQVVDGNTLLLDYYRAQYQGIARANLAIEQISAMEAEDLTSSLQAQYLAEARFLRAFYYFRLVRVYGGVPLVTDPSYSSDTWKVARASVAEVYAQINSDLEYAAANLPAKSEYDSADLGRVTSGAAEAMLLKVYLYQQDWANAAKWGAKFIADQASEYSLEGNYEDIFALDNENGSESVFEIQYMEDPTSDYGEGDGFTRGTFTTILTRSRSGIFGNAGWGFCKPTQSLYDEFEDGDPRRDASILNPKDSEITNEAEEIYMGCRYLPVKRTLFDYETRTYPALSHDTRSPINKIEIRLADVYLLYAEALNETGNTSGAMEYVNKVRSRAGLSDASASSQADVRTAIRHERRCELAMEGHRWFDIVRWGIAKDVMDAYKAGESAEVKAAMSDFVEGKNELFPIPYEEVRLGGLEQNPGY